MNKLILIISIISGFGLLAGCQSTQSNEPSALATDEFQKSKCQNCTQAPFYVDGQWLERR